MNDLGTIGQFGEKAIEGVFFISSKQILFSVYNPNLMTYYTVDQIKFDDITSLSSKKHGITRLITIKTKKNYVYSIMVVLCLNNEGVEVDKDKVVEFILGQKNPRL